MSIKAAFDDAINRGVELQVKFKNDPNPAPLGPGKVERIETAYNNGIVSTSYKMHVPAAMGGKTNAVIQMILPIVFDVADVLWFTEGPLNSEGEKVVHTPGVGNANRTPGGLHIPR